MVSSKAKILIDIALNLLSKKSDLSYIVESKNWIIKWDGKYITKNLNNQKLLKAKMTTTYKGVYNQLIHFGSVNTFLTSRGFVRPHKSNKVVLTWFHIVPDDPRIKFVKKAQEFVDIIHTSCTITKNKLIEKGVPEEKIVIIPLGVELELFRIASSERRKEIKEELNIPKNKIVIGSFQKDGIGWDEGLKPKLIKGPDIFIKVIEQLSRDYPIYILLVGPARGYVKNNLENLKIPYKNIGYLKNFTDISQYYHALDLYLITSRVEGGPKQILESWASGIPVVSTKVGMIPDIAKDGKQALLAEIEDIEQLIEKSKNVIKYKDSRKKLVKNGLEEVKSYSWEKIAKRYYNNIYAKYYKNCL